jgi:hypothetical protein
VARTASPQTGSSYDLARQEDLAILRRCMLRARYDEPVWGDAVRATQTEAFTHAEGAAERARQLKAD